MKRREMEIQPKKGSDRQRCSGQAERRTVAKTMRCDRPLKGHVGRGPSNPARSERGILPAEKEEEGW